MRRRLWFAVVVGFFVLSKAHAAFNGFMPLQHAGQVSYHYGYAQNAGTESESTSLLVGWGASGYVWRPWFATTSMALNVGLTSAETSSSSSEGTVGTGSFSIGVFPRSRFPFSMSFSRTDSRSQQFQDLSQVSGDTSYRVTRLTLRQSYRPRAYNQLYNARYSSTVFDGDSFGSDNEVYGLDYQLRVSRQTLSVSVSHSGSSIRGSAGESTSDVVSMNHVYTPSAELGVNSLASYVEVDPGGTASVSMDTQAFSSFFWRPEHRAVNVNGGVRLTETKTDGGSSFVSRSLNTNLGLGYRITRALNMNASASLGTSDSGDSQSLSTTQAVNLSYSGGHLEWKGFSYTWQWGGGVSSSSTRTETNLSTTTTDRQNYNSGLGHNAGKSWSVGRASSLAATFSQSLSVGKSSDVDLISKTVNHGTSLSWNTRGGRGSTYISARVNDSRSFSENDTVYDEFSVNYNTDYTFNRLSSMSGNANFQSSRNELEDDMGATIVNTSKSMSGGVAYRNSRPFGIYNMQFTSNLLGSKQIDSETPSTTLRWESVFRYSLGLLSTSLSFRFSESAGGNSAKSMNFQATRSF